MTVVVGVDRSETSTLALREAIREAAWRETSLVVGYVVQRPVYSYIELGVGDPGLPDVEQAGLASLQEYLTEVESTYDGGFPVPVTSHVLVGHAGSEIVELARRHDAGLLVLGSRGFGGVKGLLLGSVTTYAVHHIERPLLVVPAVVDE